MRSMGTPEATSLCMATSTRLVSGASEMPEAMIEAGMSGMSGSLVGSGLLAMMAPLIGALRGDFVALSRFALLERDCGAF